MRKRDEGEKSKVHREYPYRQSFRIPILNIRKHIQEVYQEDIESKREPTLLTRLDLNYFWELDSQIIINNFGGSVCASHSLMVLCIARNVLTLLGCLSHFQINVSQSELPAMSFSHTEILMCIC